MTITSQDAIALAAIAILEAALPGDVRVDGDVDFDALRSDETRAVEVQVVRSQAQYNYAGDTSPRDWLTQLRITCATRADTLSPATGRASSALHSLVDQALSADPLLGDTLTRALRIEELRPDLERGANTLGVVVALYSCEHETAWNALA